MFRQFLFCLYRFLKLVHVCGNSCVKYYINLMFALEPVWFKTLQNSLPQELNLDGLLSALLLWLLALKIIHFYVHFHHTATGETINKQF